MMPGRASCLLPPAGHPGAALALCCAFTTGSLMFSKRAKSMQRSCFPCGSRWPGVQLIFLAFVGLPCTAQEGSPAVSAGMTEMARLAPLIGAWKGSFWSAENPDSTPSATPLSAVFRRVLNGAHLEGTFNHLLEGRPFEGRLLLSYDWHSRRYIAHLVDNSSTQALTFTGTFTAPRTLVLQASRKDDRQVIHERIRIVIDPAGGWDWFEASNVRGEMSESLTMSVRTNSGRN